ncbi:MAG: sensor histidine kinase [Acidobacteria bacterium]|nr:sensor histidine kinase [Acidobacteriota bacterium]
MKTLRSQLIAASLLWTAGLLALMHMLSMVLLHFFPAVRGRHSAIVVLGGAGLMVCGVWVLRRALAPFRRIRENLAGIRAGTADGVSGSYVAEVQPLVDELNGLLEEREQAVRRALATAGDLAHGLKTPLALLNIEVERLRAAGDSEGAEAVARHTGKMARQVDYHLARARAASGAAGQVDVVPACQALARTMRVLHAERGLTIEVPATGAAIARVRPEDLDEILGNLLENACQWARSRVVVSIESGGGELLIAVEDDGRGLSPKLRTAVLERGVRADEAVPGSGLGLAIARDLCELYRGAVRLEESPLGGLRACVRLPSA